jgi:hypothetical protein
MFRLSLILMTVLSVAFASPADAGLSKWYKRTKQSYTARVQKKDKARVGKDVQRLESILASVKSTQKISAKSWKSVANEADSLSIRILANVKSATSDKDPLRKAEQLRTHVQNMKKEAFGGDYKKTRQHAERALSVATKLDDWAG